jgi:hypothetical protein
MKTTTAMCLLGLLTMVGCAPTSREFNNTTQDYFFTPLVIRDQSDTLRSSTSDAFAMKTSMTEIDRKNTARQKELLDTIAVLLRVQSDCMRRIDKLERNRISVDTSKTQLSLSPAKSSQQVKTPAVKESTKKASLTKQSTTKKSATKSQSTAKKNGK